MDYTLKPHPASRPDTSSTSIETPTKNREVGMNTSTSSHLAADAGAAATPQVVDRNAWQAQIDALRIIEKAHTRDGDAIPRLDGACRWSKSMPRRLSSARTGGYRYWTLSRHVGS